MDSEKERARRPLYTLPRIRNFVEAVSPLSHVESFLVEPFTHIGFTDITVDYPGRDKILGVPGENRGEFGSSREHKRCSKCKRMGHKYQEGKPCMENDDLLETAARHVGSLLRYSNECTTGEIIAQVLCLLGAAMSSLKIFHVVSSPREREKIMPTVALLFFMYSCLLNCLTDPYSIHFDNLRIVPSAVWDGEFFVKEEVDIPGDAPKTSRTTIRALNQVMQIIQREVVVVEANTLIPDDGTLLPVFSDLPVGAIERGDVTEEWKLRTLEYIKTNFKFDQVGEEFRTRLLVDCRVEGTERIKCLHLIRRFTSCETCGFWIHMKTTCSAKSSLERIGLTLAVLHDRTISYRASKECVQVMMTNVYCGLLSLLWGWSENPTAWENETKIGTADRLHGPFESNIMIVLRLYNYTVHCLRRRGLVCVSSGTEMRMSSDAIRYLQDKNFLSPVACQMSLLIRDALKDPPASPLVGEFWKGYSLSTAPGSPLPTTTTRPPPSTVMRRPLGKSEDLRQLAKMAEGVYADTPMGAMSLTPFFGTESGMTDNSLW